MESTPLFALQFVWFLVAWSTLAYVFVAPRLRDGSVERALSIWIAPQLFRVLGVGLLVPSLAPEMPRSFALPTAVGDAATAVLACIALIALHRGSPNARALVCLTTVVGACDLAVALGHAVHIQAARHLAAQWYVATLAVPLMIVSHAMVVRTLLMDRRRSRRVTPSAPPPSTRESGSRRSAGD